MENNIEKVNCRIDLLNDLLRHDKISRKLLENYVKEFSKITLANKKDLIYKNIEGKPRLISYRNKELNMYTQCPFCGYKHEHGELDGLRSPGCGGNYTVDYVIATDGTKLYRSDGYLVITVDDYKMSKY